MESHGKKTIHERRISSSIKQYTGTTRQDKMTFFFLINCILMSLCYSRFSTYFASASHWRGYYPELLKFNSWNKSQAWDAIRSAFFQQPAWNKLDAICLYPFHQAKKQWIAFSCHFLGVFKLGILGDLPKSWGYPLSKSLGLSRRYPKIVELAQRRSALAFVLFKLFAVPSVCFVLELVLPLYLTLV